MFLYGTMALLWKLVFTAVFEKHLLNIGSIAPRKIQCPGVLSQKQHKTVTDSSEGLLAEYSSLECTCLPEKGPASSGKPLLAHPGSRKENNGVTSVCFSFHSTRPSGSYSAPIIHTPHSEDDKANALLVCLSCAYGVFYFEDFPGTTRFRFSCLTFGQCLGLTELSDRWITQWISAGRSTCALCLCLIFVRLDETHGLMPIKAHSPCNVLP